MARRNQRKFGKVKGSTLRRCSQPLKRRSRISKPFAIFEGPLGLILGGLLLGLALLLAFGLDLIPRNPPSAKKCPQIPQSPTEHSPEPTEVAAVTALNRFFESPDVATMAANVHDGKRMLPMMEDYYLHRKHPMPSMSRATKGQTAGSAGKQLVFFQVEPFSGPPFPVAVIWEGNKFAVDWESLAAYGTVEWERFLEEMPTTSETLRVYVQAAGNLDALPGMPAGYATFRISHRDDPQPITAIANAELSALLAPWVENQRTPVTLALEWRAVGPGQAKVPVITRIEAKGWSR
jgi:hypothetical protein